MTEPRKRWKQLKSISYNITYIISCFVLFGMVVWLCFSIMSIKGGTSRKEKEYTGDMRIHIDEETGIQYLSRNGVLTPRLDGNGKPMKRGRK